MEIVQVKIEELKPAIYNPREWSAQEREDLKKSIQEFGLVDPILVNSAPDRRNTVIGGHFRLSVAQELGYNEVPVVFVDIPSEEQERRLNVRLNRNQGHWDWEKLKAMMDEVALLELGFSRGELGLLEDALQKEVDEDELKQSMASYLDGNIRQIVLYYSVPEYEELIKKFEKLMSENNLENHSEVLNFLLKQYEDREVAEKAGA